MALPAQRSDDFRPAWWCRNRHAQTIWGPFARSRRLALRRERVETPDGDFVDLDWVAGAPDGDAPLVLVLHGLEGSSTSHYAVGLLRQAARRGWRAAVFNFRSCSGEPNRLPRFYHSGDTGDLGVVVRFLIGREPGVRIGLVGASLGGNVVLKWLGEQGADAPPEVRGATTISVPFDLEACARVLDRGLERALYTRAFLRTLKAKVREKATRYPGFVDLPEVVRARTFAEYDRALTAPLHGFRDEIEYWTRSSSRHYLARIRRPTLLINAVDDPFVPPATLPDPHTLPACIATAFVARGGHCGFLQGTPWRVASWAEERAMAFLATPLA